MVGEVAFFVCFVSVDDEGGSDIDIKRAEN
jgi:hypothetical protein